MTAELQRRLVAILAADVAGYSAMTQRDGLETVMTVRGHIRAFELQIGLHHGKIVKTMGDGILAEFGSVIEAVGCAIEFQKIASERNGTLDADRQAIFRMGIHTGDAFTDG